MTETHLTPEKMSASEAARVVAFLNAAPDAQSLLSALDALGESGIGPGIAQRIINTRTALGNGFTSIAQLLDVPLIGPDRFTAIVQLVLKGTTDLPVSTDAHQEEIFRLARDIDLLKAIIRGDRQVPAPAITISPSRQSPYLGQSVRFTLTAVDRASGAPLGNRRVTIVSREGLVRSGFPADGIVATGASVTTDSNGMALFTLLPQTAEPLFQEHLDALEAFLASLPGEAATPEEAADGLDGLAGAYGALYNVELSEAVDILYKQSGAGASSAAFRSGCMQQWSYEPVTVMALLHDEASAGDAAVAATGVCTVMYKNWLEPWYYLMSASLGQTTSIETDLDMAVNDGASDALIVDSVAEIGRKFLRNHYGLLGKEVGKKVLADHLGKAAFMVAEKASPPKRVVLYKSIVAISEAVNLPTAPRLTSLRFLADKIDTSSQRVSVEISSSLEAAMDLALTQKVAEEIGRQVPMQVQSQLNAILPEMMASELQRQVPGLVSAAIGDQLPEMITTELKARIPPMVEAELSSRISAMVNSAVQRQLPLAMNETLKSAEFTSQLDAAINQRVRPRPPGG